MFYRSLAFRALTASLVVAVASPSQAKVARIQIDQTETSATGVVSLTGTAFGELDPSDPLNAIITDLQFAPRSATGKVEYSARFTLTRPADMTKANGVLWYDLVNRGRHLTRGDNYALPEESGFVTLVSGWQADLAQGTDNWAVKAPIAKNPDGSAITGPVLARIANIKDTHSTRLALLPNAIPYDAAWLDTARAKLVVKSSEQRSGVLGPTRVLAASDWAFADCSRGPFPGTPNPRMLCLKEPFDEHVLYEVTYDAKDPIVLGTGLAALRDVASFFRYETADSNGTPNPVAGQIKHAIAQGISQSGNALKTFLLLGFNEDEQHRIVFDGANPHIAGRLTAINLRFGLPSGSGTLYEAGGEGTLWWTSYADPLRKRPASSLLDRCRATKTCPKIFETFGATEFNARLMTVALTGTDSRADLPLPDNVRRYYFPGTTHGGDDDGGFVPRPEPLKECVLVRNPNPEVEQMNALQAALTAWVVGGKEPPKSVYPTLRDGDLKPNTVAGMHWPAIPGAPEPTGMAVGLFDYDFGDTLNYADFSGVVSHQPPGIRQIMPPLMPHLNADGNETSGLPSVQYQAPLGTYTGWNVTAGGFFKGQPCGGGLAGGFIPFAQTHEERSASGDPRLSLEERYGSMRGYMCVVDKAIAREKLRGLLLSRDAGWLRTEAAALTILPWAPVNNEAKAAETLACEP
jgi:hypothetical protein